MKAEVEVGMPPEYMLSEAWGRGEYYIVKENRLGGTLGPELEIGRK